MAGVETKEGEPQVLFRYDSPDGITYISRTPSQIKFAPEKDGDIRFSVVPVGPWEEGRDWKREISDFLGTPIDQEPYDLT